MKIVTKAKLVPSGIAMLLLAACGSGGGNDGDPGPGPGPVDTLVTTPTARLALQQNNSCDELRDYVGDTIADLFIDGTHLPCIDCAFTIGGEDGLAAGSPADPATFDNFTGTNSQEAGVDELDLVEADANGNFYLVDGDYLVVSNGLPPEDLREIASLPIMESGFANGLLLDEVNSRLVIAVTDFREQDLALGSTIAPEVWAQPMVELFFIDVADPANPVITKQLLLEGFKVAARRIDARVHVVSHFAPVMPITILEDIDLINLVQRYHDAVANESPAANDLEQQIRDRVDLLLAQIEIEEFIPGIWEKDTGGDYVSIASANCEVTMPDVSLQYALTSITSIDSDGENAGNLVVANTAWNVYASQSNLYLIQPSAGWWWDRWQREQTAIYKFAIGDGAAEYRAMGVVDGTAWNSFQYSEYDDHLRVATNRNEFDPADGTWTQDNHLFVLADDASGALNVVGSVRGYGENEAIFSSRFLGDRGFVVTFRRIDPLFAFDLSDPQNPQLMGELEIPGVSTYIHPLDDNHLLTVGFSGDEFGLNPGFQLQIFDVQDLASPQQLHVFEPDFTADGFAWTQAAYNHLAFNYYADAGVLTIPVQYFANELDEHFSGFAAFSVDPLNGFAELGRLDHSDLARDEYCPDTPDPGEACVFGYYLEAANPLRSVSATVGNDTIVYTFSNVGIRASNASDFSTPLATLPLDYPNRFWWWSGL